MFDRDVRFERSMEMFDQNVRQECSMGIGRVAAAWTPSYECCGAAAERLNGPYEH